MDRENDSDAVELVRKHSRLMVRELDTVKANYMGSGCTFTQCHVLFELAAHKSLHLHELVDLLLLDKSNASRTVKKLIQMGLVNSKKVPTDQRQKSFSLTSSGKKVITATTKVARRQVESALGNLDHSQRETVVEGMKLYANALRKSRLQSGYQIRAIKRKDNSEVAAILRDVLAEFGAVGDGYSIVDPEIDDMFGNYQAAGHCYRVVVNDSQVMGAAGIAPLLGGKETTCELRKMFFRPEIRGLGLGRKLLLGLLDWAREYGFRQCYLETLGRMPQAINLYVKCGFEKLDKPMGNTGHCSCDNWYLLKL